MKRAFPIAAALVLGFLLGRFTSPTINLESRALKDNAILRQEVELYKKMVATLQEAQDDIKAAADPERNL